MSWNFPRKCNWGIFLSLDFSYRTPEKTSYMYQYLIFVAYPSCFLTMRQALNIDCEGQYTDKWHTFVYNHANSRLITVNALLWCYSNAAVVLAVCVSVRTSVSQFVHSRCCVYDRDSVNIHQTRHILVCLLRIKGV